jgi:hypothetical protein
VSGQAFHHGLHACGDGRAVAVKEKTDQHAEADQYNAIDQCAAGGDGPVAQGQLLELLAQLQQQGTLFFLHQFQPVVVQVISGEW